MSPKRLISQNSEGLGVRTPYELDMLSMEGRHEDDAPDQPSAMQHARFLAAHGVGYADLEPENFGSPHDLSVSAPPANTAGIWDEDAGAA